MCWNELRFEIAGIDFEQWFAALYLLAPLHINGRHNARYRSPNGYVFRTGFDDARTKNIGRKRRLGWLKEWFPLGRGAVALVNHCNGCRDTEQRKTGKQVLANHCMCSLFVPSTTSTTFPSSIWAMRSANSKMRGSCVTTMTALSGLFAIRRSTSIVLRPVS